MKEQKIALKGYPMLLSEIKKRVRSAQYEALKAVNKELVGLYWDIGKMIVMRQYEPHYGKAVVERLAVDLQKEFPGITGFSVGNLWRMRAFFENYGNSQKLAPLVRELAWSHNIVIMEKCKKKLEREFYIRMAKRIGWSKNVLIHQIENQTYEKSILGQTNFNKTLTSKLRSQAKLAVKDEYIFDFLELSNEHSEKELENALILRIEKFLQTMGSTFAFVGRQFRLEVDGEEFFIDFFSVSESIRPHFTIFYRQEFFEIDTNYVSFSAFYNDNGDVKEGYIENNLFSFSLDDFYDYENGSEIVVENLDDTDFIDIKKSIFLSNIQVDIDKTILNDIFDNIKAAGVTFDFSQI
jgi:predicted nuclease of restriction endonuclease-like (RecB) superfamily